MAYFQTILKSLKNSPLKFRLTNLNIDKIQKTVSIEKRNKTKQNYFKKSLDLKFEIKTAFYEYKKKLKNRNTEM